VVSGTRLIEDLAAVGVKVVDVEENAAVFPVVTIIVVPDFKAEIVALGEAAEDPVTESDGFNEVVVEDCSAELEITVVVPVLEMEERSLGGNDVEGCSTSREEVEKSDVISVEIVESSGDVEGSIDSDSKGGVEEKDVVSEETVVSETSSAGSVSDSVIVGSSGRCEGSARDDKWLLVALRVVTFLTCSELGRCF